MFKESDIVLNAKHIVKQFPASHGRTLTACNDINLNVYKGKTLGIVGESGCGKTTLLRDLIRQVSDGSSQKAGKCSFAGVNVGVADERSELGACYQGVPQNDLGMRTDVLDGCPKSEGMLMLIRSMAPAVVAVDEIGGKEDIKAVEYVRNCGCALAATAHGSSLEELKERAGFRELLEEKTFERLVFLSRKRECRGKVEVVYDSGFNRLYSGRTF